MISQILAGVALFAAGVPPVSKATPQGAAVAAPTSSTEAALSPSADGARVADWIATSRDNHALPYAVIDKHDASMMLFDGRGKLLAQVPVLLGIAPGDDATPGVGSKKLGEIGPAEKTTPAGRFLAKFGYAAGRQRVLWVDYTNSVAIHPIPGDAAKSENRRARMLSPEVDDNRITFGCINVPKAFYASNLRPLFEKKGGYVYVLPDTRSLEDVFPRLRVHALTSGKAST
ncbi:L,D-transpeptidase [Sphingomonas phyllosphaerae]|uniref:L,D-transpeptidase n=1 Tax=Sphingomonas phyllosphaerae TaxID=257003 RepID=UPI00041C478A|nr:L,D-transpeptidase [Sphingomonas phyllosphaerae]